MSQWSTEALTAGQGFERDNRRAVVSGHLLRLARESIQPSCSQERLAELLAVSPDAIAGWESGRRPLTAVKVAQAATIRSTMLRAGASAPLVQLLDLAVEADQILDHAPSPQREGQIHPLGAFVHRREVVELVAWPLSDRQPSRVPSRTSRRRGPAPLRPEITQASRSAKFDQLRLLADASLGRDNLLHRQALYLLSYDRRSDAGAWMADQYRRTSRRRLGWSPEWPVIRTLAASLVRYGDPTALIDFTEAGLADDAGQAANLNYWAYWVGEMQTVERDDSFMPQQLSGWRGDRILRHLVGRLAAEDGVADLGIHTLKTLLAARPRLLDEDQELTATLVANVAEVMDSGRMSPFARQALAEIRYALRLHTR